VGRARSFDDAKLLAGTAQLFRRLGYVATSLKDLERETGLKAGSLYNAFGNKKNVFLRSLDAYHLCVVRHRIRIYLPGVYPPEELTEFFTTTYTVEGLPNPGCLLTNAAAEIGADDPDIQKKIEEGFSLLRDAFASEVRAARGQKLPTLAVSAETAAEYLLSAYQGLLIRVRSDAPAKTLDEIVRVAIRAIFPERIVPKKRRKPSR